MATAKSAGYVYVRYFVANIWKTSVTVAAQMRSKRVASLIPAKESSRFLHFAKREIGSAALHGKKPAKKMRM